ncbi:DMT family transporter [Streptomyces milbemycinicus]|uniref:DMT family transporter n=1 Tax=Streptomyces milbemycinicus TaxID=476552 RepID=UPI0033EF7B0F
MAQHTPASSGVSPSSAASPAPSPATRSTSPRPHPNRLIDGPLPILTAATLWGTTGTASSMAPSGTPAAAIGAASLALGGLLLFLTTRGRWTLFTASTGAERRLLALGALAVAGCPLAFYPAVARTGVAVPTVIALGSAPVFTGLLAWATGQARPTVRWAVATLAAVTGCAVLVLGPQLTGEPAHMDATGIALAALSGLSYGTYSLIGGRLIGRGHPSSAVMGAMFGLAGLLALPVLLATGTAWLATVRGAAVALHLGVFPTFLAYRLFGHGLRHTPASVATTLSLAESAVAAVLGVAVVGERLPMVSWCGLVILALGVALLAAPRRTGRRGPG